MTLRSPMVKKFFYLNQKNQVPLIFRMIIDNISEKAACKQKGER